MRPSGCAVALVIAFFVMMSMGGVGRMMMGGMWFMPQMLFPFVIVALVMLLARPRHAWRERRRGWEPVPPPSFVGTPEEVLRQRYARGELTRNQYQEAIIELLKGRYVTGELTLEEYETRVGTLLADSPQPRLASQATPPREYV